MSVEARYGVVEHDEPTYGLVALDGHVTKGWTWGEALRIVRGRLHRISWDPQGRVVAVFRVRT